MTGNENVCKTIWKKKNGNSNEYNEKYILCFFVIWNSKSAITYECQTIPFNVYFYIVRSMFLFLFNRYQSKAGVVNQMNHVCFGRRPAIGQFNVQIATAKKKNCVHWVMYKSIKS